MTVDILTSTNYFLISLARVADVNGLDTIRLLQKTDINPALLRQPGLRVNTKKLAHFVWLLSNELKDESLGQRRSPNPPGTFYTMGELAVHQPNLQQAMNRGVRFHQQVVDGYSINLVVDEKTATIRIHQPRLDLDPDHLLTDLVLLALHRFYSWLIGDNITLSSVFFAYSRPPHADEYRLLFPCERKFSQSYSGFSFPALYLNKPVIQNPDKLKAFMYECPLKIFMRPQSDRSISTQVQEEIQHNLNNGGPSLSFVSTELGLSNRTLRRKLANEGTAFQALKDTMRRDLAVYYLSQKSLSVSDVAEKLGFSEPGVFVRAFKKWDGVTPGAYKK